MVELSENTNIIAAILAIFPTFFYSMVIYFMLPKKMVSFRRMRKYFGVGLASPLILMFIYYLFPGISSIESSIFGFSSIFIMIFVAAFFEEISKYATYKWVTENRLSSKSDYPIATMMYSLSAAAGFAIVENFHYAMRFSMDDITLFIIRGFSANILHLICGLMIGYFVAKSNFITKPLFKSKKKLLNNSQIFITKYSIVLFGIIVSACYHTLYNSNSYIPENAGISFIETTFIIFVLGIFITYYMTKELVSKSRKIRKEKNGKS